MQLSLFTFPNPLQELLGKEFFSRIPKVPGVYYLCAEDETVLYVGKAKNLRSRLLSYQRAKAGQVSRKVIQLIHQVKKIRWEELQDECSALLRENLLLRSLRPEFNELNTRPDTYFLIGLRQETKTQDLPTQVSLRLTMEEAAHEEVLYGRFKNRSRTYQAFGALRRLLWGAYIWPTLHLSDEFQYPLAMIKIKKVTDFCFELPPEAADALTHYLKGSAGYDAESNSWPTLIHLLSDRLAALENVSPFYRLWFEKDLELLRVFYQIGPRRNFQMSFSELIPHQEIDDLLTLNQFQI